MTNLDLDAIETHTEEGSMTEIDQTMRNLLAAHRAEVNELEADVERWKDLAEFRENEARTALRLAEKVRKQEDIIESLRIELADEREAHTATKDKLAAAVGAEMRGGDQ